MAKVEMMNDVDERHLKPNGSPAVDAVIGFGALAKVLLAIFRRRKLSATEKQIN